MDKLITNNSSFLSVVDLCVLKNEFSIELTRLLDFWSSKTVDSEHGGFIGEMDHSGKIITNASKGCVLNTRILWTFSAAYRTIKNIGYKEIADRAYKYLIDNFWDTENGGLYWELDYLGNPINKRKQAYAQGFGVYAFSEYYRATKNEQSLTFANELFEILETKFWDNQYLGYIEALNDNWSVIADMRLSDKDMNAPKSMNTHLHILEPYTNLFRASPNEALKAKMVVLLDVFQNKIIDKNTGHFNLFFNMDWSVQSTAISFGHDIEGAWLMHEAAHVLQDNTLIEQIQKTALKLVNITLEKGLDIDGSLFNELDNNHFDKDKHWWPQAEAMVGLIDAYEINPIPIYITSLIKIWDFIKNNLIDTKNGEWYWRVDKNSTPITSEVKVGFWKCPYHNGRALMELVERIEKLELCQKN